MARTKTVLKIAGGTAAVLAAAYAWGTEAEAKSARTRGNLTIQTINVAGRSGVAANQVIEITFNTAVDAASVTPATLQVRAENATGTGYTKQVFGTFQVAGNAIRFFPRLPGHLRNPDDAQGNFYPAGSAEDDAADNAGLQPASNYQVTLVGRPAATAVRAASGRPLRRSVTFRFSTAAATNANVLWTTQSYSDSPPPQYSFSNPIDTVPSSDTQYAVRGGTKGVPNAVNVQLYCARVPLSVSTARVSGNVTLTMLERNGNPALRRPVQGSVFVEQNYESTLLVYKPQFALADKGEYALRVTKSVKDLTEQYDFKANRDRERLRAIYDFLSTARGNSPGTPAANLPDPPQSLIGDWPPVTDTAGRGVLKTNILALGDSYPDEFDPRTMIIFTTRDEPITTTERTLEFLKSENLFDAAISTGDWDTTVPSAASAIFTASGGTAVNGDFLPTGNTTLNAATYNYDFNFRDVTIPQGVTVTITGTRPVTLKAINFTLLGTIDVSGRQGTRGNSASFSAVLGGAGGPGGGKGGDSSYLQSDYPSVSAGNLGDPRFSGKTGTAGVDTDGGNPTTLGGQGGIGGRMCTGTYYHYGGGGGGGGARTDGTAGQNGTSAYASWNGTGGAGGARASVQDLNPLFGGAGGGAGANGGMIYGTYGFFYQNWYASGSAGGGGGGALMIQTARTLTIGTSGKIVSKGGDGNSQTVAGSYYGSGGPSGGGSGGSVLLRSTQGFNITNGAAAFDVTGGNGGTGTGSYPNVGGRGAVGFIRTEDPNGGTAIAGATQGTYDPVGGGEPSFVYSKWVDLGVDDPRILPWTKTDIATEPTTNDAVYVQVQATREDPSAFGTPDTSAVGANQDTTNPAVTSGWLPIKIHDRTGIPGGAFPGIPGWDPDFDGTEFASFPIDSLNGKGYRFLRFRIYFQLDDNQTFHDVLPSVDFITTRYQYNL